MDNTAQRSYVKIRFQLGDSPSVIHSDLKTSQRETPVSLGTVQRWCKALEKGTFKDQNGYRPGRPVETTSAENILRVKKLLKKNPKQSVREVSSGLSLAQTTVYRIITVHLKLRNVLFVWVPCNLSDNDKRRRVECCQDILSMFNSKAMSFIASHYVVEDESWFVWDQKERRNPWIEKKQTKPTVTGAKITKRKTMLLVVITCNPKRYSLSLLPPGHTVNSDVTIQFLKDTRRRFSQVRRNPIALKDMVLQCEQRPSPHMQQNHDLFEAGGDSATKIEPVLAWLEHLRQISIQKTGMKGDERGHPGLSWRRYVGWKTATRPDIGKGAGERAGKAKGTL